MADITDPVCMREVTEHGEGAMVNQYCTSNAHFVSRKKEQNADALENSRQKQERK